MIHLHDIRYVRIGTRDIDHAVSFATRILGLELGEGIPAPLTCARMIEITLSFICLRRRTITPSDSSSEAARSSRPPLPLEAAGHPVHWGTASECEQRRVAAFLSFKEPSGTTIDLVTGPWHSGRRYLPARDAGITGFSHIGLYTTSAARDEQFWTGVCNARVSDWIGEAPLLRIDPIHHKIALFPSKRAGVQHINHQVASIDDVMRSYYFLRENGVPIRFGPGRHPTSGAMFLYFEGPDGMTYEYSTGVRSINDDGHYQPRKFPFKSTSFCCWGSKPDIPEFKT